MAVIHIASEEEFQQKFLQLAHAVNNMRHAQKFWSIHFGGEAKRKKEHWEQKVDGILNLLGLYEHQHIKAIKVINQ